MELAIEKKLGEPGPDLFLSICSVADYLMAIRSATEGVLVITWRPLLRAQYLVDPLSASSSSLEV